MKPKQLFTNLLAGIQAWPAAVKTSIATRQALLIAHLRARWAAAKAWLTRKKKFIFWSTVILATALVASILLVYLYRRSPMVRAAMDHLLGDVIRWPGQLWAWFKRETPEPVQAIAGLPREDVIQVVAEETEPIPAIPGKDGTTPEAMKL